MLAAMKRVTLDGNSSTVAIYFLAQLEYPKILYTEGATQLADTKSMRPTRSSPRWTPSWAKLFKEFKDSKRS